jgi:phosphate-selective porin OprO and OprP
MKKTNLFRNVLMMTFAMFIMGALSGQVTDTERYNQYGVKVSRNPLKAEARDGILVFESDDQNYKVWYDVRVQVDGGMFFGDTYNPIGNGTSIRRARFAVKSEFAKGWYAEFDMDISNSELEIKDALVEKFFGDNFSLRAGNFKEGFSMETTTTSRYLTFIERANAVATFGPSRHIGFDATYSKNLLFATGGVFFQEVGGLEERIFSEDNNKDFGTDEGYSLTGKLVLMPMHKNSDAGLHFGAAGSYRTPKSDSEIAGALRYSTRSLTSINRKKYMDTDLIGGVDHSTLTGLEFAAYKNQFRLQAEYIASSVHYIDETKPAEKFNGFYVFGSWLLFGGKHTYNTGEAEFTQPRRGKEWGDIELALRYDYLSLNSSMDGVMGGAGEGYTAGLNFHVNNNVKIMLNYAYMNHDRYASGKNKLFVGYDLDGNLTRNPRSVADGMGKAGEDFSMLLLRVEVDF